MIRLHRQFWGQSLLARLARMLLLIALLSLTSLISSLVIADSARGEASAINIAGSLRMKTYRAVAMLDAMPARSGPDQISNLEASLSDFEATLASPTLTQFIPSDELDRRAHAYRSMLATWQQRMRPLLIAEANTSRFGLETRQSEQARAALLTQARSFVTTINDLVTLLQDNVEAKLALLRLIQGIAITAVFVGIAATIYVTRAEVLVPLKELQEATKKIRRQDLSVRVAQYAANDLDGLGLSFNLMAEDLDKLYQNLERKVAEKTESLARSNKSLELLYRSIGRLYPSAVNSGTHLALLNDFEKAIGVGHGLVCLAADGEHSDTQTSLKFTAGSHQLCQISNCSDCQGTHTIRWREFEHEHLRALALPLHDTNTSYGVLQWVISAEQDLEPWQIQLLEALSTHMGIAIGEAMRAEQSKRWSVYEERAILARELHDSLAQSLSYMRIQVCRLKAVVQAKDPAQIDLIMASLDDGLAHAYHHLRELLSTFRVKAEDNLTIALEKAAAEFSLRGSVAIRTQVDPAISPLSTNEEINLLQITREALANAIQHAKPNHIDVSLHGGENGTVQLIIDDDGIGVGEKAAKIGHHGLLIMHERANHIRAEISIANKPQGGTRVAVQLTPSALINSIRIVPSTEHEFNT